MNVFMISKNHGVKCSAIEHSLVRWFVEDAVVVVVFRSSSVADFLVHVLVRGWSS